MRGLLTAPSHGRERIGALVRTDATEPAIRDSAQGRGKLAQYSREVGAHGVGVGSGRV